MSRQMFACVADALNLLYKWFSRVRGPAATQARQMYCIFFSFAAWFQNSTTQIQCEIFDDLFVRILL